MQEKKVWIHSRTFDVLWFIFPQLIPALLIFFIPQTFLNQQRTEIFPISWVLIVLAVDVAHVYSSVYKTYFKPEAKKKLHFKLKFLPLFVWMGGIFIYSISSYLFWSCLAYFAVYHFIRQQFGFFKLYTKIPIISKLRNYTMTFSIYAVTVIPMLIWHCNGQQNFNWMLKNDFKYINIPSIVPFLNFSFIAILIIYLICEYIEKKSNQEWNWGRILLTLSTAFAWYSSIVLINNDFTFSLVNVLGHGIPYLALVWITEKRTIDTNSTQFFKFIFAKWGWIFFYAIVFIFAYVEEGIWDSFIWREHPETFGWLYFFNTIDSDRILSFFIPLLIMPQVVHYILDASIWKRKQLES